jgi:hypothetical protein
MSLFPGENIRTKEIESCRGFADSLKSEEDKRLFLKILEKCHKYAVAINAKGSLLHICQECDLSLVMK